MMRSLEDISIRDMHGSDLPRVLQIERNSQPMPWSRLSFEESLSKNYHCRVIVMEDVLNSPKTVEAFHVVCPIMDELHIMNLAVAPSHQGQGLGHVLMQDIVSFAMAHKKVKIFLEVRASNSTALSLYRKWQFEQIAIRKKYYRTHNKEREDAFVLVRKL